MELEAAFQAMVYNLSKDYSGRNHAYWSKEKAPQNVADRTAWFS